MLAADLVHLLLVWTAWLGLFWALLLGAAYEVDERRVDYSYVGVIDLGQEPIPADELAELLGS